MDKLAFQENLNQQDFIQDHDLSLEAEKKIARSFMGRIEWEMIVIGLSQFIVWLGVWGLVLNGLMPLWLGFFILLISATFAYLPSHAGQHGHLSGNKKNLEWLDFVVGQISLIPLAQSHDILKVTHLKHHAHTNDPSRDPDYTHTHTRSWFESALIVHNQTGDRSESINQMIETWIDTEPKFKEAIDRGTLFSLGFFVIQIVMAINFPLETLFLWWLPRKFTVSYLGVIFSHMPHRDLPVGRHADTRFWANGISRFFNHSMQIHAMHHMYPKICHHDEPKAIEALRPFMIARGIPGAEKIPERITNNPLTSLNSA
ncbi:fatty acid desaturase [SAR86 cluster bacterium]|nr:fatty acid desaturase [SAR86 cluster bacterium]